MSKITEYMKTHRKPETFKRSCGATVNVRVWVEDNLLMFHARCWKCDKELDYIEHTMLIECACFDAIDNIIKYFKRQFNSDEKKKPIRVVK